MYRNADFSKNINNIEFKLIKSNRINPKYLDSNNNVDLSKVPQNVMSYIAADERKAKYLDYTLYDKFYDNSLETMDDIVETCSKDANITFLSKQDKGVSNDSDNFYIYDIINKQGDYVITEIISIEEVKGNKYGRIRELRPGRYIDVVIDVYNKRK